MKKNGLIVLIILLILVIAGLISYIVLDDHSSNEKQETKDDVKEKHETGKLYKNQEDQEVICSTDSTTPYAKGTKYTCDNLGDGKSYTFYVLNDASNLDKVDLIMNQDYAKSSYAESVADGANGPIKAMKKLPTLATWTNLESPKDSSGYDYSQYAARLPMASEIASACGITSFNEKEEKPFELKTKSDCSYLWENTQYVDSSYQYSGYLTSTYLDGSYLSWIVNSTNMTKEEYDEHVGVPTEVPLYDTVLLNTLNVTYECGVRPVISLSK